MDNITDIERKKKIADIYNKKGDTTKISHTVAMNEIEQVQRPRSGGTFAYFLGQLIPFKGFVSQEEMERVDKSKAVFLKVILFAHKFIKNKLKDPNEYCVFVREIYRSFNVMIERERGFTEAQLIRRGKRKRLNRRNKEGMVEKWSALRDIICYCLDNDPSYKFRAQDFATIIDIEKCKPDENDEYWMKRRREKGKYNYGGKDKNWAERSKTKK